MDWIQPILNLTTPESIAGLAIKATMLLGAAMLVCILLKRASASFRYFIIALAIFISPSLPVIGAYIPGWEIRIPAMFEREPNPITVISAPIDENIAAITTPVESGAVVMPDRDPLISTLPLTVVLFFLWLAGTVFMAGRIVLGFLYLHRVRDQEAIVPQRLVIHTRELVDGLSQRIGLCRHIPILFSDVVEIPQTLGPFRPAVVLPASASHWTEARIKAVLLHELAHVKRHDHLTWPLANLAASWLWFNPLTWLALYRLRLEKEKACDDYVLNSGTPDIHYAEELLAVVASLRGSAWPAPVCLTFARRNEMKERITCILDRRTDRRPMNLKSRFIIAMILTITIVPVAAISGFRTEAALHSVTPVERDAIIETLSEFYDALSVGDDYEYVRGTFLTSDYFDSPALTLENLDRAVRRVAFDNTLSLIKESGVGVAKEVQMDVTSIRREGDEFVVTQRINVVANRLIGSRSVDEFGDIVISTDSIDEECHLVSDLEHRIQLRREDGTFKVSQYDDGVALMRMDTENPYGPIFLVWMEEIDSVTTPFGPGIFKVIPTEIAPSACNTKFILGN